MISQKPRRMVIYARISDDREGKQNGTDRQERQCRALARRNGDEVVKVFVDDDRSAYSGKLRPEYANMIKYLEAGNADGVLALAPTRLYRKLYEPKTRQDYLHFHDLVNRLDLHVQTVKAGRFDLSTADGRKSARDAASQAQYESELIGERVTDAKKDNVAAGTYRGGGRPFGFEADGRTPRSLVCPECSATEGFVITVVREDHDRHPDHYDSDGNPTPCPIEAVTVACANGCEAEPVNAPGSEAWHLEQAIRAVAAGASNRSELRKWHEAGVKTPARRKRNPDGTRTEPTPGEWTPTTFLPLLRRPRNAGLMEVDGEIIGKGAWPAIVDEETWRTADAVLKHPDRRTSPGPARRYLGGSLYRCGLCPALVRTRGRGTSRNGSVYVCSDVGHVSRDVASVDDLVERVVIAKLCSDASPAEPAPTVVPDTKALAAKRAALSIRLKALTETFVGDDDADPVEYKAAARGIKAKIAAVDKEIGDTVTAAAGASSPLDEFDRTELLWRYVAAEDDDGLDEVLTWWRETYPLEQRRDLVAALVTVTILPAKGGRVPGWHEKGGRYFDPDSVKIEWK